ncbi:hypothetical protein [Actinomadura atramentaria]|uniref:hypothetical protein n=1 Tax=Actinomadura atramentaria TaxID=1990 RepID=UPI00035EEBD0|nr:hypothetical protein [Actinomadura atramentaria]
MRHTRNFGARGLAVAVVLVGCAAVPSSALQRRPHVDADTTRQLATVAGALLEQRSQALVRPGPGEDDPPAEVLGVKISPLVARDQRHAVHELEHRNRAPVEGGPVYTRARTRLEAPRARRDGDRITLDATEHLEVRYANGRVVQSVRRRFEFRTDDEQIVLVGENVLDPRARPVNDAAPPPDAGPGAGPTPPDGADR